LTSATDTTAGVCSASRSSHSIRRRSPCRRASDALDRAQHLRRKRVDRGTGSSDARLLAEHAAGGEVREARLAMRIDEHDGVAEILEDRGPFRAAHLGRAA